jgi:hypothetical protein
MKVKFRLVESENPSPMRFPVKPGIKLMPGDVVKLIDYQGDMVADKCDGYNPLGLLGNKCVGDDIINYSKSAQIYPQRMIADVGRFDRRNKIGIGSSLYCSKKGVLSSKQPYAGAMVLAKVITPANEEKSHMQILWL